MHGAPSSRPLEPLTVLLELEAANPADEPYGFGWAGKTWRRKREGAPRRGATERWVSAGRGGGEPGAAALADDLRRFLGASGWGADESAALAAIAEGRPVIVHLRLSEPALFALPWERLPFGPEAAWLGQVSGLLLVLGDGGTATRPQHPDPPPEGSRLLFAWSEAGGEVPVKAQRQAITGAAARGGLAWSEGQDEVARASGPAIFEALEAARRIGRPFAALHLLARGRRTASGDMALCLDSAQGPELVGGAQLASLLATHAAALRLVVLQVIAAEQGGDLLSLGLTVHQAGLAAVLSPTTPWSALRANTASEVFYRRLLVELDSLQEAALATRRALPEGSREDMANLRLLARAEDGPDLRPFVFRPYRGLLPYEVQHARLFFGREREAAALAERLAGRMAAADPSWPPLIFLAGASGVGKSSLAHAGVVPALLERLPGLVVRSLQPGREPLGALQAAEEAFLDAGRSGLLLVDPFEALLQSDAPPVARQAFVNQLWGLAGRGVAVLVVLRVESLGQLAALTVPDGRRLDQVACDEEHRALVAELALDSLRRAVEAPAAAVGLRLAPGLLDRLLADAASEAGSLPLVSHTLDRLWLRREGSSLTRWGYEEVGGVAGALAHTADGLVNGPLRGDRELIRRLLTSMVCVAEDAALDSPAARSLAELGALVARGSLEERRLDAVLSALADRRLIAVSDGGPGGETLVSLAHAALIRRWARLRGWLGEAQGRRFEIERLRRWTEDCSRYHTLLAGDQLADARQIRVRCPGELSEAMEKLIAASEEEEKKKAAESEAEREALKARARAAEARVSDAARRLRGLSRLVTGLAAGLGVAVVLLAASLLLR